MLSKLHYYIAAALLGWWFVHIYEGNSKLDMANRSCDVFYWVGKYTNKEITSGFTTSESESYKYSEAVGSDLGQACFWASARLFKAVNPDLSYENTQLFNSNEYLVKKYSSSGVKSKKR